jgi:probable addiction module antidote protein
MAIEIRDWDPAERLDTPEAIALYLDEAFADGDPALISAALGDVARAVGMTAVARETGLSRENLYRSLSADGRPDSSTVLKVMHAFGVRLSATPLEEARA